MLVGTPERSKIKTEYFVFISPNQYRRSIKESIKHKEQVKLPGVVVDSILNDTVLHHTYYNIYEID